eukprot:4680083-Alexandrium_andersonii.AAC.1
MGASAATARLVGSGWSGARRGTWAGGGPGGMEIRKAWGKSDNMHYTTAMWVNRAAPVASAAGAAQLPVEALR